MSDFAESLYGTDRFYAPDGVTLVTATPKPTEHLTVGVEDPRTLTDAQRAAATEQNGQKRTLTGFGGSG
jgi:hypothetical protein